MKINYFALGVGCSGLVVAILVKDVMFILLSLFGLALNLLCVLTPQS